MSFCRLVNRKLSQAAVLGVMLYVLPAGAQTPRRHILPLQYGLPVTGAPFSAVRTLDYEPAVGSPDPTPVHGEEKIWRDSQGRTRSEISYDNRLGTVEIVDFATKTHYHWVIGDNVATSSKIPEPRTNVSATRDETPLSADAPLIEGVPTRHAHTVTGDDEKGREIVDSWYAPSLHLAMLTIIDQVGVGKTTFRYQQVSLKEPDPSLFKVPAGMKLSNPNEAPPPPVSVASAVKPSPNTGSSSGVGVSTTHEREVATQPEPEYASDPKFQKALAQAKEGRQTVEDNLENWKHANKIAHNQCEECLRHIVELQLRTGAFKDAAASAQQWESVATTERDKLRAELNRGSALMHFNGGQPKIAEVTQAEAAFHDVLAKAPNSHDAVFEEGRALAILGRNDEAKAMFEHFVDITPASNKLHSRAERFSDDPHLATMAMAPPFRLVTAQGEELNLDDMNGRVVLLDFWATWCGPCKETLPDVARLAKRYKDDPMVVIISVSQDADANAWKEFVAKNNMTWPQYRDRNSALSTAYGVEAIPHFFTIDTNGVLKTEKVGSGTDVAGLVDDLVKKAHKAAAQAAKAADKGPSN